MPVFTNEERLIRDFVPKNAGFLAGTFGCDDWKTTSIK